MTLKSKIYTLLKRVNRKIKIPIESQPSEVFSLLPELPLPEGVSERKLRDFLESVLVSNAPPKEMKNYCKQDFRRFVYTYGLTQNLAGNCLELGANPYFTTMLLRKFTQLDLTLANYFGSAQPDKIIVQEVKYNDFKSGDRLSVKFESHHFNIEEEHFPFKDAEFDVVLFCEIIEHLIKDPVAVLREIKRILKPEGTLILTTPNANRLENITKMIAGVNIFDVYSGYGVYGRHNREYNKHELYLLLSYLGFDIQSMFSADVYPNQANDYSSITKLKPILSKLRKLDLGQYIFIKACNAKKAGEKKPAFLYRSYPDDQIEQ